MSLVLKDCVHQYGERKEAPVFSICIPTYKRSDLLRQSIRGAINQIGDNNVEIIVCDNGGLASTREVVSEFPANLVSLYSNTTSLKPTENHNQCITLAKGEWITILHDDDMLYPWYLECVKPFLKEDVAAVFCLTTKGENIPEIARPQKTGRTSDYLSGYFLKNTMTAFPGVMMRRSYAVKIGGFNTELFSASDYLFWYSLSREGRLVKLFQIAAFYRKHASQTSNEVWPLFISEGQIVRKRIVRECFAHSSIATWMSRFYTYRSALKLGRKYDENHPTARKALKLGKIPFSWIPSGWVWLLTKWLSRR
jgi:glycosyltransferase